MRFSPILLAVAVILTHSQRVLPAEKLSRRTPNSALFERAETVRPPLSQTCTHRANNMYLTVSNFGLFGAMNESYLDCETGRAAPSCEFPAGSRHDYLYGAALWIGAIAGEDTLVTTGWNGWEYFTDETWPCADPDCGLQKRSASPTSDFYDENAKSDLEYIAQYTDTLVDPGFTGTDWDNRQHVPLHVEITQTSYSWAVEYAQDFILIDYNIRNTGFDVLRRVYVGLQVDGDVSHVIRQRGAWTDDICGFRGTYPSTLCPNRLDTIDLAWIADNDGDMDPSSGAYDYQSARGLTGVRVIRTPEKNDKVSFNWWTSNSSSRSDWGPMLSSNRRDFGTGGLGTPEGDANKYYVLSNGEWDYDQIFAGRDYSSEGWLPMNSSVGFQVAHGGDTRYLLSLGPFEIGIGDSIQLTIAYVGGEVLHWDPSDYRAYMYDQYDPDGFYSMLDFSEAAENAVWAHWIYDNPGVDTDIDGDAGDYCITEKTLPDGSVKYDTVYYRGDGVPDFRAASPPPAPVIRASTEVGKVTLRWNGLITETYIDPFVRVADFEGYRVHLARLRSIDDFAMVESCDRLDYRVSTWNQTEAGWADDGSSPLTLDSLRSLFGEDFDPLTYPCGDNGEGYAINGATYCFRATDWNQPLLGWGDGARSNSTRYIRKRFAEEIEACLVTSEVDSTVEANWIDDIDPRTGDSVLYHKYYEYEITVDNLLPSVPWYFAVTAFDFGHPLKKLDPLETSVLANATEVWAINDVNTVVDKGLSVQVYPNPYVGDGRYSRDRYEDPSQTGFYDHERRIRFVNLPPSCDIRIYTLDGDLVAKLHHPGEFSRTGALVEWDMRSRNNELIASGIYVYVVESEWGNHIGKIVVIL